MKKKEMVNLFVVLVIAIGSYYVGASHGADDLAQTMATDYVCIEKKW
jgi:hypothetical protein